MWCLAGAVAGAMLFPVAYHPTRQAKSSAQITVVYDSPSLALAKLPTDTFSKIASFKNDLALLQSSSTHQRAEAAVHAALDIAIAPDELARRMQLVVTGSSVASTDKAVDFLVSALRAQRRQVATAALAEFDRSIAQMRPVAEQRVQQLDDQLAKVNADNSVLAQALQAERAERADDLLLLANQREALHGYVDEPNANVQIEVQSSRSKRLIFSFANVLLGAVIGVLLTGTVVVLLAYFARRVGSRSDVHRLLGDMPVIALAANTARGGAEVLVPFLAHMSRKAGGGALAILVDPRSAKVTEQIRAACEPITADASPALSVRPWSLPLVPIDSGTPLSDVVLVTHWAHTRESAVVTAASDVEAMGGNVRGVVVAGVPSRLLEQAGL